LSQQPGIEAPTAAALETDNSLPYQSITTGGSAAIHPYMLSKWRKDVKDGRLRGRPPKAPPDKTLMSNETVQDPAAWDWVVGQVEPSSRAWRQDGIFRIILLTR
jgi:hypothetical protein